MQNDRKIIISSAGSRMAKHWPMQELWWSEMVEKLRNPVKSIESLAEYLRMPKGQQDDLKDVGGYVGGALRDGRRLDKNVERRDLVTLDLDNIPSGQANAVLLKLQSMGCAYAVYSTRKHEQIKPRLRVLLPVDRPLSAEEYEPVARKLGELIGIEMCDPTTFQASRLMYWPSCSRDSQYIFHFEDKNFANADGILAMYTDWRNHLDWPQVPGLPQPHKRLAEKQEDPTTKPGVVGAFCRVYDIYAVMEKYLPGTYLPTEMENRYTFVGGSTFGGAVVYEDKFLFSYHATDPTSGKLCNAFDLVRYHRFSELDYDVKDGTPTNRLPSFAAMAELAISDQQVSELLNKERYDQATSDFNQTLDDPEEWIKLLKLSKQTGTPLKTVDNVLIILEHDPLLRGKMAFDEFANRGLILGSLPWDLRTERRYWSDVDDAGLRHYIEKIYGITGKERVYDAAALCAHKNKFNGVKSYLERLRWDGSPRLDTLLIDYLGAEDTVYTRAVIRKSLTAAVARAMHPGTKYDYMPIFSGPQGLGKSTFLKTLGHGWYSDSLMTFEGKEASEMIQGVWINEIGELNGLSRSETNSVKQFLSRTEDIFREAYGRRTNPYPRRCVFFGTTNDYEFLRDTTGSRRFWPVQVGVQPCRKNVFTELPQEVDQVWAEAFVCWQLAEPLYLTGEVEKIAQEAQEERRVANIKEGIICEFLERPLPVDWHKRNAQQRMLYWNNEFGTYSGETMERERVCAAEVWVEALKGDTRYFKRADAMEINGILASLPGWGRADKAMRTGPYGPQKGFKKL